MFESILSWILGFFLLKSKNVIPDGISEQGSRIFLFLELQCCVEFHFLNVKGYLYQKAASHSTFSEWYADTLVNVIRYLNDYARKGVHIMYMHVLAVFIKIIMQYNVS